MDVNVDAQRALCIKVHLCSSVHSSGQRYVTLCTYHAELAHKLNTTVEGFSSDRGDKSYVSQLQGRPISQALGEAIGEDCVHVITISLDFKLLGTIAGFAHQLLPQHSFGLSNFARRVTAATDRAATETATAAADGAGELTLGWLCSVRSHLCQCQVGYVRCNPGLVGLVAVHHLGICV